MTNKNHVDQARRYLSSLDFAIMDGEILQSVQSLATMAIESIGKAVAQYEEQTNGTASFTFGRDEIPAGQRALDAMHVLHDNGAGKGNAEI